MKDHFLLLLSGVLCAALAWASWHWVGESLSSLVLALLVLAYAIDNARLRRQLRQLLAERSEQRKRNALIRLVRNLIVLRDRHHADIDR